MFWIIIPILYWLLYSSFGGLPASFYYFIIAMWASSTLMTSIFSWIIRQRLAFKVYTATAFLALAPVVILFLTTNNFATMFFFYEFFLLPSFFLILCGSPNRSGIVTSTYFLLWTQVGSFLVLVGVCLILFYNNSSYLGDITSVHTWWFILFFVGFGINVPIWPFHYWLTKTHVEAPTYFSIYLSGFLVKTAVYGLWFCLPMFDENILFMLTHVAAVGVIDSSVKMWGQVDLKKLVAYSTVQEMNMILAGLLVGGPFVLPHIFLFILAHTILSSMFFILVDLLYKRFGYRTSTAPYGLNQLTPQLGGVLFSCCLVFMGLPLTLKFLVEVYIYLQFFAQNIATSVVMIFAVNIVGTVGFMINWFSCLMGQPGNSIISDLTNSERLMFMCLGVLLVLLGGLSTIV